MRISDWSSDVCSSDLHTFGTTGKLSFVPRTKEQWRKGIVLSGHSLRDWYGPNTGPDVLNKHLPLIAPTYRYGFSTTARALDGMVEYFAGGDDNALFLYPDGFVSADVASLAGRLSAAASRGERTERRRVGEEMVGTGIVRGAPF